MITSQTATTFLLDLFVAHAMFDEVEVFAALCRFTFFHLYSAAFRPVGVIGRRDDDITFDDMMITEVFINIGGNYLSCGNRRYNGGRSRSTVTTGKHTRNIFKPAELFDADSSSLYRNSGFFKMLIHNILANSYN